MLYIILHSLRISYPLGLKSWVGSKILKNLHCLYNWFNASCTTHHPYAPLNPQGKGIGLKGAHGPGFNLSKVNTASAIFRARNKLPVYDLR